MGNFRSKLKKSKILSINLTKIKFNVDEEINGQIVLDLTEPLNFTNITLTLTKYEHWENLLYNKLLDNSDKKEDNLTKQIHSFSLNLPQLLNTNPNSNAFFFIPRNIQFTFRIPRN